ncbi:MAG: HDOD domain-containing protein [Gammaproteobacteria bacterium]|nr:HDOD domain-containing protein [Gammaproteobacteria bacterium]
MTGHVNSSVENWIQDLNDDKMPGFAGTVTDVTHAVNSDSTSAVDVAQAILRDPALTTRLLKMVNSFFYNPSSQEISTVSRAVMVLGFDQVRALALSLVLIDSLSDGQQRDKLTSEIALSFHAAVQAQELARKTKCKSPENIFVATLLSRLGNMAFWAFADDKAQALLDLVNSGDMTEQEAENKVLGFSLKDLTRGLSKSWSLGELLDNALSDKKSNDPRLDVIEMGQLIAESTVSGWDSEQAKLAIEKVSDKLNLTIDSVKEMVHTNAKNAKKVTRLYGITKASNRIPQPNKPLVEIEENQSQTKAITQDVIVAAESTESESGLDVVQDSIKQQKVIHPEPDSHIQMTILGDISRAIEEKPSINVILEMVLEGLYRGVGMDRSLFAVISKDHKKLTCKYAVGADSERLINDFTIDISSPKNIFNQVIKSKKAAHIPADPKQLTGTLTRVVLEQLGAPPYLVMPTIVKGKVIGMYMADRNLSKRDVKQEDFVAFQQFCQQANMGLTFLTTQG